MDRKRYGFFSPSGSQLFAQMKSVSPASVPIVQAYPVMADAQHCAVGDETVNEAGLRTFLSSHSWPNGLQECLIKGAKRMPVRYIICDDSGSMASSDGKKIVKGHGAGHESMVPCSRWEELTQSLRFHAELAHYGSVPTEFRMLNRAAPVRVGSGNDGPQTGLDKFCTQLEDSPVGGTPLCRHIEDIVRKISADQERLRAAGQMACVIIATDGEATDGNLVNVMRPLKHLPVWIVVRLCTNQSDIADYWSAIDKQLELNMEVLDDFQGEAREIYKRNPWLTYGEPFHRLREFGVHMKEVDFLDEQRCQLGQVRTLCATIFGGRLEDYPHPEADWVGFRSTIERLNAASEQVYSPVGSGRRRAWVELAKVQRKNSAVCVIC